ncbi:hypothetical protein NDU88_005285 [Pleurodeles waltl]|uniref:Uncharacterized protein n=1 Tax=Pleurodeles waltl TaxID=8319 RepID=A0AAV7MGF1_PLEWA|nr:hypothetical protein NDU88_005285 [Pleurodeles waltl]
MSAPAGNLQCGGTLSASSDSPTGSGVLAPSRRIQCSGFGFASGGGTGYFINGSLLSLKKLWILLLTLKDHTLPPWEPNPVSLETIYQSIMEHQEESKSESRRTQLAGLKMQIQIRRVAKTCSEFTTRMEEVETRISHLEDEAGSHQVTREAMEKQLEDTQWKLTDLEDSLRRNNLRILGVPEGLEGADTHSFMVALFKEAFPDLHQWDWDREIQRAHRFPFSKVGSNSEGGSGRPRAILISLLNYQARQAIYDRARPNSRSKAKGCKFFIVRPDFCHSTVEKRWRLRQLIQPL